MRFMVPIKLIIRAKSAVEAADGAAEMLREHEAPEGDNIDWKIGKPMPVPEGDEAEALSS